VYIGNQIGSASESRTEQQSIIGIPSGTMQNIHHVWHQHHLIMSTKLRLYSTLVLPVLLYRTMLPTWQRLCPTENRAIARGKPHPGEKAHIVRLLFGHIVRLPSTVPCNAWVEQVHLHEWTCSGGLTEAQGSPTHFVNKPGEEGYKGTNSYILRHVRRIVNCRDWTWTLRPLPAMGYKEEKLRPPIC